MTSSLAFLKRDRRLAMFASVFAAALIAGPGLVARPAFGQALAGDFSAPDSLAVPEPPLLTLPGDEEGTFSGKTSLAALGSYGEDAPPPPPPPIAESAGPARSGFSAGACKAAAAAAAKSHKGLFYNNDFSYLSGGSHATGYLGDSFKRLPLSDSTTLDVGGQFRMRQHAEQNHRGVGVTGVDDDFLLYRTRLYANLEVGDCLRAYAEMIDAVSNYENFGPRPIEENRADFINLFGDAKLYQGSEGALWARLGRQELLYGAQRTVSPLDWANTRRTFEGYKGFWKGKTWDVDAFWTRPMTINVDRFDSPNYNQEFMGVYTTYKGCKNGALDIYYLRLEDEAVDFDFDTIGTRLLGSRGAWSWELEAAIQFGDYQQFNHDAGAWTLGLGRKLQDLPWNPTIWVYYDWASGSNEVNNGYHHLFPLSHKYLGFMDLFGRRNIETPNVQVTLSPCEKLKLLMWYSVFFLENQNDVPYNVTMTPFNPGNAPASAYLGQELDLTADWQFSPRTDLLFGYSHFFAGDYYFNTPGVPHRGDADFLYTQFTVNF